MDLKLVNPQAKYAKITLIDPPPLGYIHLAAAVDPPPGPTPIPGRSRRKAALLIRLRSLARQLETLTTVESASVYHAILIAPPAGFTKAGTHVARYDVVALIETTSPEVLGEVQGTEPYRLLVEAVTEAATDVHVMTARCPKRVGEVDKTRQGLFLFNYFVADDAAVALQLWEHLAGWYAVETGLELHAPGAARGRRLRLCQPRTLGRQPAALPAPSAEQAQLPHLPTACRHGRAASVSSGVKRWTQR